MNGRLPLEYDLYGETDEFILKAHHEGFVGRSAMFYVRPEGIEETGVSFESPTASMIWPMGTTQLVSWRIFGFDDPESLSFTLDLYNDDTVWSRISTSDVSCDRGSGICSKTISVNGSRMAGLVRTAAGTSLSNSSFEVNVSHRPSDLILATDRSERFAVTQPRLEIISPAGGDILRILNSIPVRLNVLGGAQGPFNFFLHNPALSSHVGLKHDVACSACPSASPQEVSSSPIFFGLPDDHSGDFFLRGRDGFTVRVASVSDPDLSAISEEFTIDLPELRVIAPDSGDTWHNGEYRLIRWEIDISTTISHLYRLVDIKLRDEATHSTHEIVNNVLSSLSGGRISGEFSWHVGRIIHHPGGLDDGMLGDLAAGRYTIMVKLHSLSSASGRSSVFNIE